MGELIDGKFANEPHECSFICLQDTAGQERYHSLAPMYYRGAQAAIVVYDIQNQDSFVRAQTWVKELQRQVTLSFEIHFREALLSIVALFLQASPNIVIALAGNKADLAASRAVDYEEAKQYADENGLLFMETSAKTAVNVNEIFLAIGKENTARRHYQIDLSPSQLFAILAKKLPKNEGTGQQQNIRPTVGETNRSTGNCCNK